jgi:hypothetical protein
VPASTLPCRCGAFLSQTVSHLTRHLRTSRARTEKEDDTVCPRSTSHRIRFIKQILFGLHAYAACALVNCGQGGDCEKGAGSSYQCRCQPGLRNMFNLTSMPCIGGNCNRFLKQRCLFWSLCIRGRLPESCVALLIILCIRQARLGQTAPG